MKNILSLRWGLWLVLLGCVSPMEKRLPDLLHIQTILDNRWPSDSLYAYGRHEDYMIRTKAIAAFAQLQDTASVDSLLMWMRESDGVELEDIVFALGQTGYGTSSRSLGARISDSLVSLWSRKSGTHVREAMLEAIGKTGRENVWTLLGTAMKDTGRVASAAAMSYAILAYRGSKTEALDTLLPSLMEREASRWPAVYAAMRSGNRKLADGVARQLTDPDARVRMDAARALGAMKLDSSDRRLEFINALVDRASNDEDWRVRVNAVNALGTFRLRVDDLKKVYFLIAFEGRRDSSLHVRLSAIRAMASSYAGDVPDPARFMDPFFEKFLPAGEWQERSAMLQSLSKMFDTSKEARFQEYVQAAMRDPNRYARALVLAALPTHPSSVNLLREAMRDSFALVRLQALDGASLLKGRDADAILEEGMRSTDATVFGVAAGYLADRHTTGNADALARKIVDGYASLQPPIDVESQLSVFDHLGKLKSREAVRFLEGFLADSDAVVARSAATQLETITGTKFLSQHKPRERKIDEALYRRLATRVPTAVVRTSQGDIRIELLFDQAPLTVMNFVRLTERGFWKNGVFHRVVPNFVIQGGDPTGTGWGGPGYSIRGEYHQQYYERGMVGMASAGKDTEGCQWFITHSSQWHLNGRYTIFGRVTTGMDVVDRIQVGDEIAGIDLE